MPQVHSRRLLRNGYRLGNWCGGRGACGSISVDFAYVYLHASDERDIQIDVDMQLCLALAFRPESWPNVELASSGQQRTQAWPVRCTLDIRAPAQSTPRLGTSCANSGNDSKVQLRRMSLLPCDSADRSVAARWRCRRWAAGPAASQRPLAERMRAAATWITTRPAASRSPAPPACSSPHSCHSKQAGTAVTSRDRSECRAISGVRRAWVNRGGLHRLRHCNHCTPESHSNAAVTGVNCIRVGQRRGIQRRPWAMSHVRAACVLNTCQSDAEPLLRCVSGVQQLPCSCSAGGPAQQSHGSWRPCPVRPLPHDGVSWHAFRVQLHVALRLSHRAECRRGTWARQPRCGSKPDQSEQAVSRAPHRCSVNHQLHGSPNVRHPKYGCRPTAACGCRRSRLHHHFFQFFEPVQYDSLTRFLQLPRDYILV